MSKQFDLEQQILDCWHVTDDIDVLYSAVCDTEMSRDDIANVLLGLKTLYALKFDRCFTTFEELLQECYVEKINRMQFERECG